MSQPDANGGDARAEALLAWVRECTGDPAATMARASDDASFRRYLRIRTAHGSYVAMDAPPDKEDCRPFVDVARRLRAAGLNAPAVHASDLGQGFLLLDDLGDRLYLDALNEATAEALYDDALQALLIMQRDVSAAGLPNYDEALLRREMALFCDWLLARHLGLELDMSERAAMEDAFDWLVASALEQPRVFVHLDYHSRNLMCCDGHNPGILDFQDAVAGPITYDLVSLLRDCYIAWPHERVADWRERHHRRLVAAGVLPGPEPRFERWFDLMGMQRHLKAAGIFARLNHRDRKPGYLGDIPRTLDYVHAVCAQYEELGAFGALLERRVVPALADGRCAR